jgi:hypothetical protein
MASGVLPARQQGILQTLVSLPISAALQECANGFCNCWQQPLCALDILSPKGFSLHQITKLNLQPLYNPEKNILLTASVKGIPQNKERYLTRFPNPKPRVTLQSERRDRAGAGGENKFVPNFRFYLIN